MKDAARALDLVGRGVAEDEAQTEKRRARLAREDATSEADTLVRPQGLTVVTKKPT